MRPRISKEFKNISFKEIVSLLNKQGFLGTTVKLEQYVMIYSFYSYKNGNYIYVEISKNSKGINKIYDSNRHIFNNVYELKKI